MAGMFVFLSVLSIVRAEPLRVDLTAKAPPTITGHIGLGQTNAPGGHTLWADSVALYRDGKPWIPVMGEIHYTRYPRAEWRDALLKMKAGGVDIVATYVFWIHHEEVQGEYNWISQRSLRDFLLLCCELNMLSIVRLGPWSHGEVRNGGFPDWLQHAAFWPDKSGFKNRTTHPEFMKLVENHYRQISAQMQGLLWKDGGPVIGVQHDNECWNLPYLFALKKLARDCGIDVPYYTMTGWNSVPIPDADLLPLFGAYADGFWLNDPGLFRKAFFFSPIRDDGDMGAINGRIVNTRPERNTKIQRFPFACCEIGGGMPSSYSRRIHVGLHDTAALALVRLGCGNNLPGYYMFQGGINPEGRLTALNETRATGYPNDLPVKDYDFEAPLGACGQVRDHYHLLRQQHLFVHDYGNSMALMPAFFPQKTPAGLDDSETLRWSVRSDGQSGFLFFNNHQRDKPLPAKAGVQFDLITKDGINRFPSKPVCIPSGAYGIWPFNMDFSGIQLDYATAQPLCKIVSNGQHWYFFAAIEGVQPEFAFKNEKPRQCRPGLKVAFTRKSRLGSKVSFIVLTPEQARHCWKLPIAGQERVVISSAALLPDSLNQLRVEAQEHLPSGICIFPPVQTALLDNRRLLASQDGIFARYRLPEKPSLVPHVDFACTKEAATSTNMSVNAMDESSWKHAAVWRLKMPQALKGRPALLRVRYIGDVLRVYVGGRLFADHFWNSQPFDFALWRIPTSDWNTVELHIMPQTDKAMAMPCGAEVIGLEVLEKHLYTLQLNDL